MREPDPQESAENQEAGLYLDSTLRSQRAGQCEPVDARVLKILTGSGTSADFLSQRFLPPSPISREINHLATLGDLPSLSKQPITPRLLLPAGLFQCWGWWVSPHDDDTGKHDSRELSARFFLNASHNLSELIYS